MTSLVLSLFPGIGLLGRKESHLSRVRNGGRPPMTRPYTVPELPEPLQVPIKEAARLLGVCRETLYRMRKDQEIRFGRLRGRTLVPMAEIKRVHA